MIIIKQKLSNIIGTGQAIRIAKDGNVEILLVHHTPSELKFMNEGLW